MSDGHVPRSQHETLTGVEALVRLLVLRRELDLDAALDVACLISGYPGSPLGGVDLLLARERERLEAHRILHRPGVNEELALAAAWGSQMGAALDYHGVDGVVGAWYGKTPGLDRSGDVLKHANAMGAGPNGGLVLFCGDDPAAKSSTLACDSQYAFQDACVPVLYPGDQQEVVELGLHAFWMSRYAGPLVGLKVVTSVADGSGAVALDRSRYQRSPTPDLTVDGRPWQHEPLAIIGPHRVPDQELLTSHLRLEAARSYAQLHGLDRTFGALGNARLGIVTAGKTYYDVVQAFADLGIPQAALADRGIRILKLALTYPLVEATLVAFALSVDEVLVVEEKRPFIEAQLRAILHEAGCRARVHGKRDRTGAPLVAAVGELSAAQIASVLQRVLPELGARAPLAAGDKTKLLTIQPPARPPEYCSGCPHNRSTVVPAGALVGGGVGCHGIMYFEPRQRELHKLPPPPMGAEGVPWIGLAPFVAEKHLIQNIGDGTLSHSGILAIRASVAAGVNVTFKILYNAAVAMTGGQDVAGLLDVPALTRALDAEGVARVVVCAEHPEAYARDAQWARGVEVRGRDQLAEFQQNLREFRGVTVIIYDQRCASEARRLRRKGVLPTPPARVVINEAVCEGCGDCRTKSNCASVVPHPTEFGEKRRVDDVTCNRDYTCLEGDCPSFVTITPKREGARSSRATQRIALPAGELPIPARRSIEGEAHFGIYFTGIGGTGVVTAGRILVAAAEAAGMIVSSLDQTGLAQRGGAVVSHIHFAKERAALGAAAIGPSGADLYLSSDIFQAANANHLERVRADATFAVVDRHVTPTASMQQTGQLAPDVAALQQVIRERVGEQRIAFVDAQEIAAKVFAQHVLSNVVLLGAAFQLGALPLSFADIEAGLERRGASKENREAFLWGRWAVHDPPAVQAALASSSSVSMRNAFEPSARAITSAKRLLVANLRKLPRELAPHLQRRVAQVIDYQDASLAATYLDLVVRAAERDRAARNWALTWAVTESWFRLLTYKDEYEVARLHTSTRYELIAKDLGIEGPYEVKYHLHPPFLRRLGMKRKLALGWVYVIAFFVLSRLKFLRGSLFDVFGWDRDRKLERAVISEYREQVGRSLDSDAITYDRKVELAESALSIKGYGPVKEQSIAAWRKRIDELAT